MTEAVEQHTFQIELDGLISLLAQNLYAEPDVFLREMLQNAHDSVTRRATLAAERGEAEVPDGRIQVQLDRDTATVSILDNGSGLTHDEIVTFLATIGRSGTDELRRRLKDEDRTRTVELIGQFGIGLLSAFIVADWVEITTKAAGGPGLRWRSDGSKDYTIEPAARSTIGTTAVLHLRSEHRRYLERDRVRAIVRRYADFIGIPVYLDDEADSANAVNAPWHRHWDSEREQYFAYYEFWEKRFLEEQSLHVFAVDEPFEWDDLAAPEGFGSGRVRGVLAITDRHSPDVNARGTVDVYVSRMFINSANREVLPAWARFIQGVIESSELTPNAARDNVIRNQALAAAQRALGVRIVAELTQLAKDDRARFVEIMRWHAYHVLAMAVQEEHEQFFRAVADIVPLDSNQRELTVPEYLTDAPSRRDDGKPVIYYIAEPGLANQYYLLSQARGIRVFNCGEPYAERFLKRYVKTWPERAHLTRLDVTGSDAIFAPLADEERGRYRELEEAYRAVFPDPGYTAKVSRFEPTDLPAVLTLTRDSTNRKAIEDMVEDPTVPMRFRDALKGFMGSVRDPMTLHVNADNPIIRRLADRSSLRDPVTESALIALYNNAVLLLGSRSLRPDDVQKIFAQHTRVIENMLEMYDDKSRLEVKLVVRETELEEASGSRLTPHVSCFVAMPYRDEPSRELYLALKRVLEDVPFCWEVVRADDNVERSGLWENLKAKMLRAHCFMAIVSEQRADVMIEVGRMEAIERPMLLLKHKDSPELPTDLQGLLYDEVEAGEPLDYQVRDILHRNPVFATQHGPRFLSQATLERLGLSVVVSRALSREFSTWDDLLAADPAAVATRLTISAPFVLAAQSALTSAG